MNRLFSYGFDRKAGSHRFEGTDTRCIYTILFAGSLFPERHYQKSVTVFIDNA